MLYKTWLRKHSDKELKKYKAYKNKLTNLLRTSEKMYYRDKFLEAKNDIKNTWKVIKFIIGKNRKTECIKELTINGTTVTDEERIANKMNDYFVNIGSTLAKKYLTLVEIIEIT